MPNQNSVINAQTNQSTIDPHYRNLARGNTPADKSQIIHENAIYIGAIADLIQAYDGSANDEPITHAIGLINRLSDEITINQAGISDYLNSIGGAK